ncbi:hypothetical protein JW992_16810 [candidate division KSB1 bacterium]|nr:hypothetical protein [candidate division KSB1 bacterium]
MNALLAANPGLKEARITRNKYSLALVTAALETPAPARSEELGTLAARLAQ